MAGSLWRQKIDSTRAEQLTDAPGYDYQPDWSPDGRFIVYASAQGEAIELWLLDVTSGRTRQLTQGGAVNVEPRWSPDGQRVVYVSSAYHRHFHLFVAEVHEGQLNNPVRLTEETRAHCRAITTAPTTTRSIRPGHATARRSCSFQSGSHSRHRGILARAGGSGCAGG